MRPTGVFLTGHGLVDGAANDPGETARVLETRLQTKPRPGGALAAGRAYAIAKGYVVRRRPRRRPSAVSRCRGLGGVGGAAEPVGEGSDQAVETRNLRLEAS